MKLSCVIPVFNEKDTLGSVVEAVRAVEVPGISIEIIVVDDGSSDGTSEVLRGFKRLIDKAIFFEKNIGKGAALRAAFSEISGDYVILQDADLEYSPADYPILLEQIIDGSSQAVFGSRFLTRNKRNFWYALGNVFATGLFNVFFKSKLTDLATCYKVFPTEVCRFFSSGMPNDFRFDVVFISEILVRRGFKIKEVPIGYKPRPTRQKKLRPIHGLKILWCVFIRGIRHVFGKDF